MTFVAISRAPVALIEAFKNRMGWSFKWVSSFHNDFNFDYQASFTPQQLRSGVQYYNYEDTYYGVTATLAPFVWALSTASIA